MDALLNNDPRWGICEVELRGSGLKTALAEQDHLYTVSEIGDEERFRVVGAMKRYLTASNETPAIFTQLLDPAVKLISLTVTEKGYCLNKEGGLDPENSAIVHDLGDRHNPSSVIGWITRALQLRRAAKIKPFVVLSCDNVAGNGRKLRRAVQEFANLSGDGDLASWIADEVRFPSTMVDSITPATTPELLERITRNLGYEDKAPVNREAYLQWVIEDDLGEDAPDLASVGAVLTHDIEQYEQAKLRLLNGTHSTLAYIGLLSGYKTVGEAMKDKGLAAFIETMMRVDIAATLRPPSDLNIPEFITTILRRYQNPGVQHKLAQIGADGSQKVPYRLLAPISDLIKSGRPVERMTIPVAAWLRFVVVETGAGRSIDDPMSAELTAVARACCNDARRDVGSFLSLAGIFPRALVQHAPFVDGVTSSYHDMLAGGRPWCPA